MLAALCLKLPSEYLVREDGFEPFVKLRLIAGRDSLVTDSLFERKVIGR